MDNYTEQIMEATPTTKSKLAFFGSIALTALGVFMMLFVHFGFGILAAVIGGVLIAYTKAFQSIEYEYLFVNGDCEIACIMSKSSRKNKFSFTEGEVLRILKYDSDKCKNELQVNLELVVKDFTSGDTDNSSNWYVFFLDGKKRSIGVILELNDKTLEHVNNNYKSRLER